MVARLVRDQKVVGSSPVASTKKYSTSLMCCIFYCFGVATGLEGGSRFAGAKRFALQDLGKRGICWQSPTLITSGRGAPLKAQVPDARQARYSVATLLTASTTEKVLKQKVSRLFSFPKTAVKIELDHMFDHLRIFLRFYELRIAVFLQKNKNSFSLFTAYQILRGDD